METINERIKKIRKTEKLSQKEFANKIGISQRAVSWSEQSGNNVPDSTIKTICIVYNISEEWLKHGTEPMYLNPKIYDLDKFMQKYNVSELEMQIIQTYFELDVNIRRYILDSFKNKLTNSKNILNNSIPDTPEELESLYPPIDPSDLKQAR